VTFQFFHGGRFDPRTDRIDDVIGLSAPDQKALVCYAFLNGTESQRRACDNYPSGYLAMDCRNVEPHGASTRCEGTRSIDQAPFDQGDGHYAAHFVNVGDPSVRFVGETKIWSDGFLLSTDALDVPFAVPGSNAAPDGRVLALEFDPLCTSGFICRNDIKRVVATTGTPRMTIEIKTAFASELRGCQVFVSTEGTLSTNETDARALQAIGTACASPSSSMESLGWRRIDGAGRTVFAFEGASLADRNVASGLAFAVGSRVRRFTVSRFDL